MGENQTEKDHGEPTPNVDSKSKRKKAQDKMTPAVKEANPECTKMGSAFFSADTINGMTKMIPAKVSRLIRRALPQCLAP